MADGAATGTHPGHTDRRLLPAFAAGAILLPLFPVLPPVAWPGAAALPCLFTATLRPLALFLLGITWSIWHADQALDDRWPRERNGDSITLEGEVTGLVERTGQRLRFLFEPRGASLDTPARIRVSAYRAAIAPRAGETWRLELKLSAPAGRLNPRAFDFERWLLARGIGATADLLSGRRLGPPRPMDADHLRLTLAERLQAAVPDLRAAGLLRALAVADRGGIDDATRDLLRTTGTAHLLAISGLHVGMVGAVAGFLAGGLGALLGLLWPGPDRRRVAVICGLVAALGYALLAGFTLPTRRAVVMLAVFAGALVMRRVLPPGHALVVALVAVVLVDPLAPLDGGFWLSFSAVTVLVWIFGWRPPARGRLRTLLVAQLSIVFGMLPLVAGWFQHISLAAVPANLIAIPLTGIVILPALLAALATLVAGLPGTEAFLWLSATGIDVLLAWLEWLSARPGSSRAVPGGNGVMIAAGFAGTLWLLAPRGVPGRWLGLFLVAPLLVPAVPRLSGGEVKLWALDTGQGQAVVIDTAESTWLYDTGPGRAGAWNRVDTDLAPMILAAGGRLDGIIVSRAGSRHAGGLRALRERFAPATVLGAPGVEGALPCRAGQSWSEGGVDFRILHPRTGMPAYGDDSACVLHLRAGGTGLLLAGSASGAVMARLTEYGPLPPSRLLIAHAPGADDPDLAALIARAGVRQVVVTGNPAPDAAFPGGHRVDRCGAVRITAGPGGAHVAGWRALAPKFWRSSPRGGCISRL